MVSHSRPLLICVAIGVIAFPGCLGDIWEQAQNAAERKQTFNELKQYSLAWFAHHDRHNRGPKDWQELNQFAPGGLQQTLEGKGYQFVWGASFSDMMVGTSNTIMAYPSDAATSGGLVSMADGSVQLLTAEEFNQKFSAQDVGNKGAAFRAAAAESGAAPAATGNNGPPGPPAASSSPAASTSASSPSSPPITPASESSSPAESRTFSLGQTAYIQYSGKWEPVEILEVLAGNRYKVRWINWGPQWDEVRTGATLLPSVPPGGVAADRRGSASPLPTDTAVSPVGAAPSRPTAPPPGGGEAPGVALEEGSLVNAGEKVHAFWFGQWMEAEVIASSRDRLIRVRVPSPISGAPTAEISLPRNWVRGKSTSGSSTAVSPPGPPTPSGGAVSRTWTDSSGKFKIEAKFISLAGGQVTLEKPDGVQLRMPLDKLSAADQKFVTEQALRP